MCGITGLFYRQGVADAAMLTAMRDSILHRGPDDGDNYLEGPLGLGHRRLSIVDLGGGHQPMFTEDGRFVVVYNGEIYNYPELRRELEAQGARFRTHSDTEVILHLHARLGDAAVERLNGIFAYALWDRTQRRLLLARDRAGIKPLYYVTGPRGLAFASEIKALFRSDLAQPRLNAPRVGEYLMFRQVAGPENLFDGVLVLPPGHTMTVVDGVSQAPVRYWSSVAPVPAFTGSYQDAVEALDRELNDAVKRQLMSDVPLGTFCSGGIDSSLTTAIAARHAGRAINTFSVGFHEAGYDESEYARMASKACGTTHHELRLDEREFAELLPKLVYHHDLPLNFANSVHIYAISALARRHVTVVLTGEGADELFGGYPRYYIPRISERLAAIPGPLRAALLGLAGLVPDHRVAKLRRFASESLEDILLYNSTGTDAAAIARVWHGRTPDMATRKAFLHDARRATQDSVSALAALDFQTYLVSILNRQDKMSMATSIEARVPFLDNEIITFARSLPVDFKQTLRHRKRVLKDVALRYLPAEIVHRRKSGFGVPLAPWFRGQGPMATLLDSAVHSPEATSALEAGALQAVLAEHREGRADHSELLWGVLNLALWRQAYRA
jgi:asparagine synthase (glutamine-hydrolysing)